MNTEIWTFKYEPNKFEDIILNDDIRLKLKKTVKEIPNLMLIGPPGVGKGTFTNYFLKETKLDFIKINCSDETGIDNLRTKVKSFAQTLGTTSLKIVVMNECLEENEEIKIGTIDDIKHCKMNNLPKGLFLLPSLNINTEEIEDDIGEIVSDKIDDVYEVELEDGRRILATLNHPFIVRRNNKLTKIHLFELNIDDKIITF